MEKTEKSIESEKTLEARLVSEVTKMGGMALKYTSQYHRGIPDRIVLMPGGTCVFAEIKSTGKKPTLLQRHAMEKLRSLGFQCYVVDSDEALGRFLTGVKFSSCLMSKYIGPIE